jgi:hypothetical protein
MSAGEPVSVPSFGGTRDKSISSSSGTKSSKSNRESESRSVREAEQRIEVARDRRPPVLFECAIAVEIVEHVPLPHADQRGRLDSLEAREGRRVVEDLEECRAVRVCVRLAREQTRRERLWSHPPQRTDHGCGAGGGGRDVRLFAAALVALVAARRGGVLAPAVVNLRDLALGAFVAIGTFFVALMRFCSGRLLLRLLDQGWRRSRSEPVRILFGTAVRRAVWFARLRHDRAALFSTVCAVLPRAIRRGVSVIGLCLHLGAQSAHAHCFGRRRSGPCLTRARQLKDNRSPLVLREKARRVQRREVRVRAATVAKEVQNRGTVRSFLVAEPRRNVCHAFRP